MRLLELFSGTKSVSKALRQLYPEAYVLSLDIEPKMEPDICMDIVEWNYKDYEKFDVIWASPNCKEYSISKTRGIRDLESADALVLKVLEIIDYFKPKFWFIENPLTGLLKTREFMKDLPYYSVDYCRYGFNYMKKTAIWTNL